MSLQVLMKANFQWWTRFATTNRVAFRIGKNQRKLSLLQKPPSWLVAHIYIPQKNIYIMIWHIKWQFFFACDKEAKTQNKTCRYVGESPAPSDSWGWVFLVRWVRITNLRIFATRKIYIGNMMTFNSKSTIWVTFVLTLWLLLVLKTHKIENCQPLHNGWFQNNGGYFLKIPIRDKIHIHHFWAL